MEKDYFQYTCIPSDDDDANNSSIQCLEELKE